MSEQTRLLIVDDSALYRQTITNVLRNAPEVEVVGVAKGGLEALEKIEALDPDLLTLDVQMPDMDGISVLREIGRRRLRPKAIMVSSLTSEGARVTTDALLEGAFDFILKPTGSDAGENLRRLRDALDERISAFREGHRWRTRRSRRRDADEVVETEPPAAGAACRVVCIAASTGGPVALKTVLPKLPADFPAPVLVVQHMPSQYTRSLANRLDALCALDVKEAAEGDVAAPGTVLIAPGGRQMRLVRTSERLTIRITDDPPENGCQPAADYLIRSVTESVGGQALAVVLTGMGRDGTASCALLKAQGGAVFAQHQDDCVVYGMPKAVAEAGLADRIVPLERMTHMIVRHVTRSRRR